MSQEEREGRSETRAPEVLASAGTSDMASLPEVMTLEGDSTRWFFLKTLKRHGKFYPSAERLLMKKFKKNKVTISTLNFLRTCANLCAIETGLVPVTPKKLLPVYYIQNLLSLSIMDRMIKLTDSLMTYIEEQSKLNSVFYKYVAAKDKNIEQKLMSPASSRLDDRPDVEVNKFKYCDDVYKLLTWHSGEKIYFTLKGPHFDLTAEIESKLLWSRKIKIKDKLSIQDLIGSFKVEEFVCNLKQKLFYVFMDKFNVVSTEYQGFQQLPDELVENLARYLDGRSLINLSQTSRRINRILDSDPVWELRCRRITEDFNHYGYDAPSEDTLRLRLTEEGQFKEKYKVMYEQAKFDAWRARERLQGRNWSVTVCHHHNTITQ